MHCYTSAQSRFKDRLLSHELCMVTTTYFDARCNILLRADCSSGFCWPVEFSAELGTWLPRSKPEPDPKSGSLSDYKHIRIRIIELWPTTATISDFNTKGPTSKWHTKHRPTYNTLHKTWAQQQHPFCYGLHFQVKQNILISWPSSSLTWGWLCWNNFIM